MSNVIISNQRSGAATREPARPTPGHTRPVRVDSDLAGLLLALENGWRFYSLRHRFDVLDGSVYWRAEDAEAAARGIVALQTGCACSSRRAISPHRRALLREIEAVIERDAA